EAVLTGEKVEELSQREKTAVVAARRAPFARLPKHLLMRDRPRDGGDREREYEQRDDLVAQAHMRTVTDSTPRSSSACRRACCASAARRHCAVGDRRCRAGGRGRPTLVWTVAVRDRSQIDCSDRAAACDSDPCEPPHFFFADPGAVMLRCASARMLDGVMLE